MPFTTVVQKFVMAITGVGLVSFVVAHLAGNLTLFSANPDVFNLYSSRLIGFGVWLNIAEAVLLALAIIHIALAVWLSYVACRARPVAYAMARSKKGPSKWGFASRRLLWTGTAIATFVAVHVVQFKYGPGVEEGYVTQIHGHAVRDLRRVVIEAFNRPWVVAFYVVSMGFLGLHLKHGVWSSLQSLALTRPRTSTPIYCAGMAFAVVTAAGFSLIPVWIFWNGTP